MSEREAELGYPSPTRGRHGAGRPMSFSLPSLSQINLPRPESSLPANLDKLRLSQAKSLSPKSKETEVDDDSQTEKGSNPSSPKTSLPSLTRTNLAGTESMSSSSPPSTFSTWNPDDSLRFIKPHYLSSAEKETLQHQKTVKSSGVGKRKECANDVAEDEQTSESRNKKGDEGRKEDEERPKKMGRPLPLIKDDAVLGPPPLATISRERPSTIPLALERTHSRPALSTSAIGHPQETDLLRQVKSNNLRLPIQPVRSQSQSQYLYSGRPPDMNRYLNWLPAGNYTQDQIQYTHIHQHSYQHHQPQHQHQHQHQQRQQHQQQQQSRHFQQPQQNNQTDLFTYAPLYHPPSASSYIYRPDPKPKPKVPRPEITPSTSSPSTEIHARDRNFSPNSTATPQPPADIPSSCAIVPSPHVEPASVGSLAALELPHGDWRRRYVGRGRGQSGG